MEKDRLGNTKWIGSAEDSIRDATVITGTRQQKNTRKTSRKNLETSRPENNPCNNNSRTSNNSPKRTGKDTGPCRDPDDVDAYASNPT
jgi:hypothetical protein